MPAFLKHHAPDEIHLDQLVLLEMGECHGAQVGVHGAKKLILNLLEVFGKLLTLAFGATNDLVIGDVLLLLLQSLGPGSLDGLSAFGDLASQCLTPRQ